jgi:hypothetical protein
MTSKEKPKNPSAFPREEYQGGCDNDGQAGMTLRDYFAAKAMQGMQSNIGTNGWSQHKYAIQSYNIADEMLKQREL